MFASQLKEILPSMYLRLVVSDNVRYGGSKILVMLASAEEAVSVELGRPTLIISTLSKLPILHVLITVSKVNLRVESIQKDLWLRESSSLKNKMIICPYSMVCMPK